MGAFWISIFVKPLVFLLCTAIFTANGTTAVGGLSGAGSLYRGRYIGKFTTRQHKVSGEVYATDARTIHIRGFTYDGAGPDAFFWTGFTQDASPQGIIIPDERGTKEILQIYNNQDITITLPDGLTLRDIKWLAVWCRAYEVNFGDLYIPNDLDYPQPHVIGSLQGQHGVSSGPIVVVDAQTLLVPDFSYDGQAPDVHFWVGRGKPGPEGARVPDETGGDSPLLKSDKKTMVLSLPGDLTIFDIDYFGIWCRLYYVDFGHVRVPKNLNVPPSLRMLGVTPQTKLNCEVLHDDLALEVRWAVAGESIVMQLVGRIDETDYMSFGLSGDDSRSSMIGGDVVVGWFEKNVGRGHVVDYFLDSKSQCSGRRGTCPDSRLQAGSNNVRLLSAAVVNGFTMLTFQRPLKAHDELDKNILTNGSQPVIWAVGPVNQRQEASYHKVWNKEDLFIEFGRAPKWNCPAPEELTPNPTSLPTAVSSLANLPPVQQQQQIVNSPPKQQPHQHHTQTVIAPVKATSNHRQQSSSLDSSSGKNSHHQSPVSSPSNQLAAWRVPPILCHEPEDRVFYAQMGPTGGQRGYSAITGHVGWGISWYINGLLVPEIYVVRGMTYTFVVEGGSNPDIAAKYHPFYITDDPEGGFQHKSPTEKKNVKVFAGVGVDSKGENVPTATGRLCQWTEHNDQPADSFPSYGAYQRSLSLHCDDGHPGILHWTPDENTPDLVFYQCYTHRYLGWKIHVVDGCGSSNGGIVGGGELAGESTENLPAHHQSQQLHYSSVSTTPDQEVEESIHQTANIPPHTNTNHIKNPIDSGEARVPSSSSSGGNLGAGDGSNGKSKLIYQPEHKTTSTSTMTTTSDTLDKSQLNEKQELVLPGLRATPSPLPLHHLLNRPEQQQHLQQHYGYRRPLTPSQQGGGQPGYIQLPSNTHHTVPHQQQRPTVINHGIYAASSPQYNPIQYNPEHGHPHQHQHHHHPTHYTPTYADHFGQRILEGPGIIYEPRTGLDYIVGPTGRPSLALPHSHLHPSASHLRYENVNLGAAPGGNGQSPLVIVGSTIAPPILTSSPKIDYSNGKQGKNDSPLLQGGPLIRVKPDLKPMSSESVNVKYVDYIPSQLQGQGGQLNHHVHHHQQQPFHHYRGSVVPESQRGRPPHSRNLPKREQLSVDKETTQEIRMGLRSIGAQDDEADEANLEIIKIKDMDNLPFDLTQDLLHASALAQKKNNGTNKPKKYTQDTRKPGKKQQKEQEQNLANTEQANGAKNSQSEIDNESEFGKKFVNPQENRRTVTEELLTQQKLSPVASPSTKNPVEMKMPGHHRFLDNDERTNDGFKGIQLTSLEPIFRPSPKDVIQVSHGAQQYRLEGRENVPILGNFGRREYVNVQEDLMAAATTNGERRSPITLMSGQRRGPTGRNSGPILTYDGRPVDRDGVNFRPSPDGPTPSIRQHRPQFVSFRGDLPPPIPQFVPQNLPQLSSQQSYRGQQKRPDILTGAASERQTFRVPPPPSMMMTDGNDNKRMSMPMTDRRPSKPDGGLLLSANDDVTILRGTDEKGIQSQVTNIQQSQLAKKQVGVLTEQNQHSRQPPAVSMVSGSNLERRASSQVGESTQVKQLPQQQQTQQQQTQQQQQEQQQQQNSTDLHILTDIWSNINLGDGAGVETSRRHHGAQTPKRSPVHYVSPPARHSQPVSPIDYESIGAYRHQRQLPEVNIQKEQVSKSSRKKRSADHEPGHEDHSHHDHDHPKSNSVSHLIPTHLTIFSLILSYVLLH